MGLNRLLVKEPDFISHDIGESHLLWLLIYLHSDRLCTKFFEELVPTKISQVIKWRNFIRKKSSLAFLTFIVERSSNSAGRLKSIQLSMFRLSSENFSVSPTPTVSRISMGWRLLKICQSTKWGLLRIWAVEASFPCFETSIGSACH